MEHVILRKNLSRQTAAFNRLELLVVIVIAFIVILLMLLPTGPRPRQSAPRIHCINNLKQIGTAIRVWENDNGDQLPMASNCWTYYTLLMNNLGGKSSVLTCPADERKPAENNQVLKDNTHLSYFVGVNAVDTDPQSLLGGDRNLGPGIVPAADYGYSPANGTGNDVTITGQVCWSLKMHSQGNIAGAGNILLGDGSAQECTSAALRATWVSNAVSSTTNSIHVLFP
jgi:hypothetical protein